MAKYNLHLNNINSQFISTEERDRERERREKREEEFISTERVTNLSGESERSFISTIESLKFVSTEERDRERETREKRGFVWFLTN